MKLIPQWIENARAKGELTEAQERDFQQRQSAVFAQPYAKAGDVLGMPAPAPDVEPKGGLSIDRRST